MRTEKREVGRDQRNVWWFSQGVALLSLAKDQSLSLGKGAYCRLMTVLAPVCQVSLPGEPEMAGETPYSPACLGTWVFHQMSVLTDASLPKLWGSSFSFCVKAIKGNWLSREKKAMVPTRCVDVRGYGGCAWQQRMYAQLIPLHPSCQVALNPISTSDSMTWVHLYPSGAGSAPSQKQVIGAWLLPRRTKANQS